MNFRQFIQEAFVNGENLFVDYLSQKVAKMGVKHCFECFKSATLD